MIVLYSVKFVRGSIVSFNIGAVYSEVKARVFASHLRLFLKYSPFGSFIISCFPSPSLIPLSCVFNIYFSIFHTNGISIATFFLLLLAILSAS